MPSASTHAPNSTGGKSQVGRECTRKSDVSYVFRFCINDFEQIEFGVNFVEQVAVFMQGDISL
jgi:hypothetical protein